MGEARQRMFRQRIGLPPGVQPAPGAPVYVEETILFTKDTYIYLEQLMNELNEELKKAGKPMVKDIQTFLAKGIIPRGIETFKQAQAEYLKDKRTIFLPHEISPNPTAPGRG